MAPPANWLTDFVEKELRAVIEWKERHRRKDPNKHTPSDSRKRFSDDCIIFQSHAGPEELPQDTRVQITQVRSIGKGGEASALVSDGFTVVSALLSRDVVSNLESELEGEVSRQTKGDVLSIQRAVVVSTPLGPPDGFVQLKIEAAEYEHCLRKIHDQVKPIEEHGNIRRLVERDLATIYRRQYGLDEAMDVDGGIDLTADNDDDTAGGAPSQKRTPVQKNTSGRKRVSSGSVQHSPAVSQASPRPQQQQQSSLSQSAFATQVSPVRKKARKSGPSLVNDVVEIDSGVNLQGPQGANFGKPSQHLPSRARKESEIYNSKTVGLLNLFSKRPAEDVQSELAAHTETPATRKTASFRAVDNLPPPTESDSVEKNRPAQNHTSATQVAQAQPLSPGDSTQVSPERPYTTTQDPNNTVVPSGDGSTSWNNPWGQKQPPPWYFAADGRLRRLRSTRNATSGATENPPSHQDQQMLQLYNKYGLWSDESPRDDATHLSENPGALEQATVHTESNDKSDGSESSSGSPSEPDDDDDDDDNISWPSSSPIQKERRLPPDSSMDSRRAILPTQANDRSTLPPHQRANPDSSLLTTGSQQSRHGDRSTQTQPRHDEDHMSSPPKDSPTPTPSRGDPDMRRNGEQWTPQVTETPVGLVGTHRASAPSARNSSQKETPAHGADATFDMDIDSPLIRRTQSSSVKGQQAMHDGANDGDSPAVHAQIKPPLRQWPHTNSTYQTSPIVVIGTQFGEHDAAEDDDMEMEMEMSVPRPLEVNAPRPVELNASRSVETDTPGPAEKDSSSQVEQDPAERHRIMRREHFARASKEREAHRRAWVKENFIPDESAKYNFSKLYFAFKAARPADHINGSDFAGSHFDSLSSGRSRGWSAAEGAANLRNEPPLITF